LSHPYHSVWELSPRSYSIIVRKFHFFLQPKFYPKFPHFADYLTISFLLTSKCSHLVLIIFAYNRYPANRLFLKPFYSLFIKLEIINFYRYSYEVLMLHLRVYKTLSFASVLQSWLYTLSLSFIRRILFLIYIL
jgi:hypothetical protein